MAAARSVRKSVTAGLSSASFCWIASALRYSASASAACPSATAEAEVVVDARQAVAEFGDGGVVVGQLLLDRQRLAVLGLRLRPACPCRPAGVPRSWWLIARSLRNSVTAGLSSASFCRIASALRYSASASAGLPVSPEQDADAVDRVRQVAPRTRSSPRGRRPGPPGSARARRYTDRASAGWPVVDSSDAEPCPAVRQRSPAVGGLRMSSASLDQQRLGLAVGRLRLLGLARSIAARRDGGQAAADVDLDLGIGRRCRPPAPRGRRAPAGAAASASSACADLAGQLGQLEVGLRQRPPRGQVRLLAQQGPELAVEVAADFSSRSRSP